MGKVWFPEGAPWTDDLVGELTIRLTRILVAEFGVPDGKVKPRTKLADLKIDRDRLFICLEEEFGEETKYYWTDGHKEEIGKLETCGELVHYLTLRSFAYRNSDLPRQRKARESQTQ
jgi:hypothetical protein